MKQTRYHILLVVLLTSIISSCSTPRRFVFTYYKEHEPDIIRIEGLYNKLLQNRPIAIEFTDAQYRHVSLEMKTDSVRLIYEFNINDPAITDSLRKYGYDTASAMQLIQYMKKIECTWINSLDYFVGNQKNYLTFMSAKDQARSTLFSPQKYVILTVYKQPQYYDEEGRLLDRRNLRRTRKINNEVFWRINDRVCYTISAKFR